ncbi:hypothetical protein VRZ08_05500 [Rhodopseudomonas sp. G2_2311]|uniref:hypothetical protein n=1 Tax=Rhodopseudomonas sp. G2_2311 TaxID=3114287 RepID=UPI0039C71FB2
MIAALFVARDGCYFGLPDVDPWDVTRDARLYAGPHPIVAHPPYERWGRYWHGSPRKPHQFKLGQDAGCFAAALTAVRNFGGVIEHPAYSNAWRWFGLAEPPHTGGWIKADRFGGFTCHVEQGHYGHMARKATWLYVVKCETPEMIWGPSPQRLPEIGLRRHGYAKARRSGVMAYICGKNKAIIRAATPLEFRDVLIAIARTART